MSAIINIKSSCVDDIDSSNKNNDNGNEKFDVKITTTDDCFKNEMDNIKKEIEYIRNKEKIFTSLCRLFTITNKTLMIINFSTILFSILITESNLSLVLSIYTLSFSILCDNRIYIPTLEKLIIIYQDEIIPQIDKRLREYYNNNNNINEDIIYEIQHIEKTNLTYYFGSSFMIPKKLRGIDWKKVISIFVIYVVSFICIAVLCFYKSKKM